jgi:hypothetical protein
MSRRDPMSERSYPEPCQLELGPNGVIPCFRLSYSRKLLPVVVQLHKKTRTQTDRIRASSHPQRLHRDKCAPTSPRYSQQASGPAAPPHARRQAEPDVIISSGRPGGTESGPSSIGDIQVETAAEGAASHRDHGQKGAQLHSRSCAALQACNWQVEVVCPDFGSTPAPGPDLSGPARPLSSRFRAAPGQRTFELEKCLAQIEAPACHQPAHRAACPTPMRPPASPGSPHGTRNALN